jgi:hypothetical protein
MVALVALLLVFAPAGAVSKFLVNVVRAIAGQPRVVAYSGRRFGVKTGAVSAQGHKLEVSLDAGTTWKVIGGIKDIYDPSGEAGDLDATNLASVRKEYIAGLQDTPAGTLTGQRIALDAGQNTLRDNIGVVAQFRNTFADGEVQTFSATIKKFGNTGTVDGVLMFSASIRGTGAVTWSGTGAPTT